MDETQLKPDEIVGVKPMIVTLFLRRDDVVRGRDHPIEGHNPFQIVAYPFERLNLNHEGDLSDRVNNNGKTISLVQQGTNTAPIKRKKM